MQCRSLRSEDRVPKNGVSCCYSLILVLSTGTSTSSELYAGIFSELPETPIFQDNNDVQGPFTGHAILPGGGSGILAFILVLLVQGWYVLKIPSKLKHDSKKKEERRK